MTEAFGQTPPMPPAPTMAVSPNLTNTVWVQSPRRRPPTTFTSNCPHCLTKQANMHALNIVTNGSVATNGGYIIQRTITLGCTNPDCREPFDAKNTMFMPESIAVEDPPIASPKGAAGGASVLPDTNAPTITFFGLQPATINDFTNFTPFTYTIDNRANPNFYWTDPETGTQVRKAFELRFNAKSNNFYTVWVTGVLGYWREYPTDRQLHPARSDFLAGTSVPIYDTNRYYCIRHLVGTNRISWQ